MKKRRKKKRVHSGKPRLKLIIWSPGKILKWIKSSRVKGAKNFQPLVYARADVNFAKMSNYWMIQSPFCLISIIPALSCHYYHHHHHYWLPLPLTFEEANARVLVFQKD